MSAIEQYQLIGRGRTADIYSWNDDQVLKLFHEWCSAESIAHELSASRLVEGAGLPVPMVEDEIVDVGGRRGLIYERVSGPSMLTALLHKPWQVRRYGRLMAELHASIHRCSAPQLPCFSVRLKNSIGAARRLTAKLRQAALQALAAREEGNTLCHGDFHPDNIIITAQGPRIIDWMNAVRGDPLTDVARSSLLLRMGEPLPGTSRRWLINLIRSTFHSSYMNHYLFIRSAMRHDVDSWLLPVAAAKMDENIESEADRLRELIESLVDAATPAA